jgi:hypothetical protein
MFQVDDNAPAAGKETSVRKAGAELPEGLPHHGLLSVCAVDIYLVLVMFRIEDFPETQPDGAAGCVHLNISVVGGKPLYDFVKQSGHVSLRAGFYQIVECPDAKALKGMVGGGGGKYKHTVLVKAAQSPRRIHSVFIPHVNIKEHKVKPFFPGSGKKIRAGGILKGHGVKGEAGKLYVQLRFQVFPF